MSLDTEGCFLGVIPDLSKIIVESSVILDKDDIMLLYTDGIIEAHFKNDRKKLFGIDRLQEIIVDNADRDINEIRDNILNQTLDWCDNKPDDDITMVLVRRK